MARSAPAAAPVLALALLAILSGARAQNYCSSVATGQTGSETEKYVLNSIAMPYGEVQWEVTLRSGACPYYTVHVGTKLEACDQLSTPIVQLDNIVQGLVTRTATNYQTGKITVTVYCSAYGESGVQGLAVRGPVVQSLAVGGPGVQGPVVRGLPARGPAGPAVLGDPAVRGPAVLGGPGVRGPAGPVGSVVDVVPVRV